MRKVLLVLVALLLVAVLVVVGCGKKDETESAQEIVNKSQEASESIKSLKATGRIDFKTPEAEEKEEKLDYEAEVNIVSEDDVQARIVATDDKGEKNEAYLYEGYMYSYSPVAGWTKQKVENLEQLQSTGITSPSDLTELSKYAENLKKLPDEGNNYVISFNVGTKFFDEALGAAEGATSSEDATGSQEVDEMMQMVKEMVKGLKVKVVMKIDKKSFYTSEADIDASMKGVPIFGDISIAVDSAFSDYNAPVEIALPAEAQNAKEVTGGLPSGLPGLPGLGF
jgi:hypothetical protein